MALVVKNPPPNAGDVRDTGSIPRLGRSPGEGNGNPLQYSCRENPMDRGGGRQSMGLQRVGHDCVTSLSLSKGLFIKVYKMVHSIIMIYKYQSLI